jgi:hypothetical protein
VRVAMTLRLLLAAACSGACIVAAWWPMPEVRLVSEAAAAVPLAQTQAEAGTTLASPPEPAGRLAEETQAQPVDELPLKEERHPPPIVNYVPPKPKHGVDDKSRKTKPDSKPKAKKPAPRKTKAVGKKPRT